MAKTCEICKKHPVSGGTLSHAHNVSRRIFFPNLRTMTMEVNGKKKKIKLCMKCLKKMSTF